MSVAHRAPLRMPKMSMTMETGELTVWRVAVGDVVAEGDVVCEVLTDKVDMEVEAPATGTVVEIDVNVGDSVPVGTPLAWIETESDSLIEDLFGPADAVPEEAPAGPAPAEPAAAARAWGGPPAPAPSGPVLAIPGARRLAAAQGLDLSSVAGTGPKGAVMLGDVRAALAARSPVAPVALAHSPAVSAAAVADAVVPSSVPSPVPSVEPVREAAPDALWALRAAALAPRPEEAAVPGAVVWRDVTLPAGPAPPEVAVLARVVAGVSAALADGGPPAVRARPRVGVRVTTPAGAVTLTVPGAHLLAAADLEDLVARGLAQAREGRVDVAFLAPPDAVVDAVPDADRVAAEVVAPAALAVGVGAAAERVVPVGEGLGVRTVVSISATGVGWARGTDVLARVLAAVGGRLPA
ncbi:biotin/lipoyl-containing protein [Kineosporia sp. A_224]|uniref:biotin/lipoyl-containing protein n=1 Tax=Kineosporia sp. A_224 TaxID=1962180 RepID=UPI001E37CBE4|nr:biotin/lipoyl-containing protein [Kineosporia sp. A_224]